MGEGIFFCDKEPKVEDIENMEEIDRFLSVDFFHFVFFNKVLSDNYRTLCFFNYLFEKVRKFLKLLLLIIRLKNINYILINFFH